MSKPPFLETARNALKKLYPRYECAFVAGSMLRGEETAASDIDIVVIYDDEFEEIHRNSVVENGWPIEFFVHNRNANDYFMEKDRQRGMCIMMNMVANGISLPGETDISKERQAKAKAIIEAGPPTLSDAEIEDRRYFITDGIDDLDDNRPALERFGTLCNLYNQLGDFYLRSRRLWSGQGKSLGRLIRLTDPNFAKDFEEAFATGFQGDFSKIIPLAESILSPHGGRCFAGYERPASKEWKDFKPGGGI